LRVVARYGGAGGGGAGGAGVNVPGDAGTNGGASLPSDISGSTVSYSGGGGGGAYAGAGGTGGTNAGNGGGQSPNVEATAGVANRGGGGGGGGGTSGLSVYTGKAGGSGIVILKYLVPVGTTVTHIYKGSGSWVAPEGVTAVDYLVLLRVGVVVVVRRAAVVVLVGL
jgi:hypothetical protein